MSLSLTITLIAVSLFLIILTTHILKKGRIPEKYSLLWYFFALLILLVAVFPNLFGFISTKLGFQAMSNLIIGVLIAILLLLTTAASADVLAFLA